MNNRGQFSIIAALFVAIILISSVMFTYSSIRYSSNLNEPQILSAIDETNLALKQVLGFTVGYYGSILQVTGNSSYAKTLASNYLNSGLKSIADVRPEWGTSFHVTGLTMSTNWFMNSSYSQGILNVTYDLPGLGIQGVAYSASSRLDVNIFPSPSINEVCLNITRDGSQPFNDLSLQNFKFYRYLYDNLTWQMVNPPDEPVAFPNGTYLVNVPSEINPYSYLIQVVDTRGITVAASSFSQYTGTLTFNSTFVPGGDFVDVSNPAVDGSPDVGSHSNFVAQKAGADGVYDTLSKTSVTTPPENYYPTGYSLFGSTSLVSGALSNLQANDSTYMTFGSYASAYSSSYNSIAFDSANTVSVSYSSTMQWQHTTGVGNDRLLLVTVDVFRSSYTPRTVSSITYDGVSLIQAATERYSNDPQVRSYLFYLVNPPSGTKTISVSFSGSTAAVGGSISYANINQTNPLQLTSTNSGSGTSQSVSSTASGSYNKLLFGHLGSYNSGNDYSVSQGGGQTVRWSQTGSLFKGYGVEKSATSGTVSMSWGTSRTVSWTAILAVLQPSFIPSEQTCAIELSGSSNTDSWSSLLYTLESLATTSNVGLTLQLYNYQTGLYPTSGDGYISTTLGTTKLLTEQNLLSNPAHFRDSLGLWKLRFTAVKATASSFNLRLDFARYKTQSIVYGLSLEEQWTAVDVGSLNPRPSLCINMGSLGSENLAVDIWKVGTSSWQTLTPALTTGWNNISVSTILTGPTFTIRFRTTTSEIQNNWQIDAVLLRPESDQEIFTSLVDSSAVVAVELLQNGTMRWLGQNLQLTTEALPIPPVPVKSIHINETVNGVNTEVPFQIEDWGSEYTIPLGLTNNATVFGNRQMIVFLVNTHVSKFTVWWDGSDEAVQTPLAYTNTYFVGDNPSAHTLTNGRLTLRVTDVSKFTVTSTVGSSTSTATYLNINNQASTYGAGEAYVVSHGVVRDIIQQEAEWSNGAPDCPNLYANIVLTLPANATYYTYRLSLMFINSGQARTLSDLCPVQLYYPAGNLKTENGTILGDPVVANGTQIFDSTGIWGHHWSQFTDGTKGAGIMFTNSSNQLLYAFDHMSPATLRGALMADETARTIQLLPVTLNSVQFTQAFDIAWAGAIVTFDWTPQIYNDSNQLGLWVLAELPPSITVTTGN
jgi:hypothetical protein